jgi:hypothetical protein
MHDQQFGVCRLLSVNNDLKAHVVVKLMAHQKALECRADSCVTSQLYSMECVTHHILGPENLRFVSISFFLCFINVLVLYVTDVFMRHHKKQDEMNAI